MGLNAFFAYVVAQEFGWQLALIAVFLQGFAFIALSAVSFREKILDTIPKNIKLAIGVGIGLFISLIGFQNGGFIVSHPATLITFGGLTDITVILFVLGCVVTVSLLVMKIKGGIFLGIIITYLLGLLCQIIGIYVPYAFDAAGNITNAATAHGYSLIPAGFISTPPSIGEVNIVAAFNGANWEGLNVFRYITVLFAFFVVDVLDTVGTLIGVSEKAGFLDKNGKLPRARQAFLADAIGTVTGAAAGTSTTTTYIESATGIAEGGKTGLTALFVALFFAVALFFWPVFAVIPSFATAPALVVVGLYMTTIVGRIDFNDFSEGFPAFLTIVIMPFAYSISDGLVFGILAYVIIKIITGKFKQVSPVMYALSVFFIIKLIFT